jgi:Ca2+-binding RTX toxin-like protein
MSSITGTAGDDSITGSDGADVIFAGQGNDTVVSGSHFTATDTFDTLRGGAGDDSVAITFGFGGLLFGDNGNDTLTHGQGDGLTLMEGGPGNDLIDGQVTDTAMAYAGYVTATGGVNVSLATDQPQDVGGGAGIDTLKNLDGIVGSAFNDTLTGGVDGNTWTRFGLLAGGDGDDLITSGGVGDTLIGGAGNDTLVSTTASDVVLYGSERTLDALGVANGATGGVTVNLGVSGAQSVGGGMGLDVLTDVRHVIGTGFSDTLTASDRGGDIVEGGAGGDDLITGGLGGDRLVGGSGHATIFGGAGADTVSAAGGGGVLRGEDGNDVLTGNQGFDDINGMKGDDTITSNGGGDDWLVGGQGNDLISAQRSGNILFGNLGNDTLNGGTDNDLIRGGQGDDVLAGGGGDDWLSGDRGSDTLTGGAGADIFHSFDQAGIDRVTDFNAAEGDRVQLDAGTSYTLSQVGADVVVDMGGGNQLILADTQLSGLPAGWIFTA